MPGGSERGGGYGKLGGLALDRKRELVAREADDAKRNARRGVHIAGRDDRRCRRADAPLIERFERDAASGKRREPEEGDQSVDDGGYSPHFITIQGMA